jgi:replication initiation and membrane attachment protein DnaB
MKTLKKIALIITMVIGVSTLVNAQTKTPVKVADLQKSITDHIAKNYAGYAIKDAYKVETNKVITYEVDAAKAAQTVCLSYDNMGMFLKVITPKTTNTPTKTTTKTKTGPKTKTGSRMNTAPKNK